MSEATSLYRRHRPHSFDQVVGQEHVVRTLSNAIERDQVHHAYLFVGSRGTGKTSMAKILAASLNCANGGPTLTPCGECESCLTIQAGSSVDVIEMDAASNRSVEDIRELRERVAFAPTAGNWKVYILDEAHMLTKEAWNAFLKTLEEPPPNTIFILATTEAHKVMPTIADRCQRFDFHRPSLDQLNEVVDRVATAEGIEIDQAATSMIARAASGSFRDALGTLDQLVAFSGNRVGLDQVLELLGAADADLLFGTVDAVIAADAKKVLELVDQVTASGRDPARFGHDLLDHLRILLLLRMSGEMPDTFSSTAADPARLAAQAQAIGPTHLVQTIDELADSLGAIRRGDEARLALEIALLKAARPDLDPGVGGLAKRLERLETGMPPAGDGGSPPPPVAEVPPPPEEVAEPTPAPEDVEEVVEVVAEEPVPQPPADQPPAEAAAPEAPPEPTPAPPAAAAMELDQVIQVWPAVVDAIRASGSGPAASYLEGTRPVAAEAELLTVGFPPEAAFNRRNAEKPERIAQLVEAVVEVTGWRPQVAFTDLEGDQTLSEPHAQGAQGRRMDEREFVERIKSEFNAEEVI
ncbi:MAG: DNA polymerase III subunit gamma/tau [Solirubrobacterales bacterium]|nr:DNA polymerase III subunit gamma/tau [Solirubrobacterales bacterium]